MGRSGTYHYEAQSEKDSTSYIVQGAMSIKEAIDKVLSTCKEDGLVKGYVWPQTGVGRKCFERRYNSADLLVIENIWFNGNNTHYILRPKRINE